ncbi:hypothetical protein EVAR_75267_1 [Eumeta japonica]|uniref:Uncharacterized protein n=1 Tax=Eumeta variegata TaxID=151549 RepID=A0A4C1VAS4_EUMVA|nr:hypothetical protein EVAR_75267_1 [Eumeta japonica]
MGSAAAGRAGAAGQTAAAFKVKAGAEVEEAATTAPKGQKCYVASETTFSVFRNTTRPFRNSAGAARITRITHRGPRPSAPAAQSHLVRSSVVIKALSRIA